MKSRSPELSEWCRQNVGRPCICGPDHVGGNPHHRQPRSQNGFDSPGNLVAACPDCHKKYHTSCGQQLSKDVISRVGNFHMWMLRWTDAPISLMGPQRGINPKMMAPDFVIAEWAYWWCLGQYRNFSDGCLSRLGKIEEFEARDFRGDL